MNRSPIRGLRMRPLERNGATGTHTKPYSPIFTSVGYSLFYSVINPSVASRPRRGRSTWACLRWSIRYAWSSAALTLDALRVIVLLTLKTSSGREGFDRHPSGGSSHGSVRRVGSDPIDTPVHGRSRRRRSRPAVLRLVFRGSVSYVFHSMYTPFSIGLSIRRRDWHGKNPVENGVTDLALALWDDQP